MLQVRNLHDQRFEYIKWPIRTRKYVFQCTAISRYFPSGTPVSSTNKTDLHDIAEILLKVTLNTIKELVNRQTIEHTIMNKTLHRKWKTERRH